MAALPFVLSGGNRRRGLRGGKGCIVLKLVDSEKVNKYG